MGISVHHHDHSTDHHRVDDDTGNQPGKSDVENVKSWAHDHAHKHAHQHTHGHGHQRTRTVSNSEDGADGANDAAPTKNARHTTATSRTQAAGGAPNGEVGAAFQRINAHRAAHNLPPLKWDPAAARVAQGQADRQAESDSMFHSKTFFQELSPEGAHYANENVAMGYKTGDAVFNGWKYSPGHNANMLSPKITSVGLGVAYSSDGTPYWTMNGLG